MGLLLQLCHCKTIAMKALGFCFWGTLFLIIAGLGCSHFKPDGGQPRNDPASNVGAPGTYSWPLNKTD
jgi:hypothetical protein